MINFDEYRSENNEEHNPNWPYIPDHPYRILIIGGSGSGKTNALWNLINNQQEIDKIYLHVKHPYESKYLNHSSDINTKDLIEIYRKCTDKPYSFLVIDTTLPSNNPLRFRKNLNITNDEDKWPN